MNVTLTVTHRDGRAVTPYSQIFETNHMLNIAAQGSSTVFIAPIGTNGKWANYQVSETFSTVQGLTSSNGAGSMKAIWGRFDATGGKAIAVHNLKDIATGNDIVIPNKSVIVGGFAHVTTTFTSATDAATMSLGLPVDAVAGLKAAIAISNGANPWDAGKTALIPIQTAATAVGPSTADRKVDVTVAVEALTAGIMDVLIIYTTKP